MAKEKRAPAKGKKRGRLPTKRSINLVLIDEGKINPLQAILAVLAIIMLAGVFSKYMVIDRLAAMSAASAKVSRMQKDLDTTNKLLQEYGDVKDAYAHYTYDGMTNAEMNMVERTRVLDLVVSILPKIEPQHTEAHAKEFVGGLFRSAEATGNSAVDKARQNWLAELMAVLVPTPEYTISKWSVSDSILTVEVYGESLSRLNQLARQIDQSSIVDSCSITTANKKDPQKDEGVWARIVAYLQQPVEPEEEEVTQP